MYRLSMLALFVTLPNFKLTALGAAPQALRELDYEEIDSAATLAGNTDAGKCGADEWLEYTIVLNL